MTSANIGALRRIRWAVRATLALGVAASVAANVLHALPHPVSQTIAAWPPLALLLTVELVSRVPVYRRWLGAVRVLATAVISGIAAWVSYWHMTGVASRWGEVGASAYLLPVSVDGLIVVASISLVELAGRIRDAENAAVKGLSTAGTVVAVVGGADDNAGRVPVIAFEDTGPGPDVDLIDRARTVVSAHRLRRGREMTIAQLAAALGVSMDTAGELLDRLNAAPTSRPSGGRGKPTIGELTR